MSSDSVTACLRRTPYFLNWDSMVLDWTHDFSQDESQVDSSQSPIFS